MGGGTGAVPAPGDLGQGSESQMEGREGCGLGIAWLAGEKWANSWFAFSRN